MTMSRSIQTRQLCGTQPIFSSFALLGYIPTIPARRHLLTVFGWAMDRRMKKALVIRALIIAINLRKPHFVPLANQVIEIIEELRPHTSNRKYLFPSVRNRTRPMSEATINAALRRLGYSKEEMTGHGFRHMASTLLNEQGCWNPDAIERQLANTDRNKIRGTYDHSKHITDRRKLMQSWADYLDNLKSKNTVIPFPVNVNHQATVY